MALITAEAEYVASCLASCEAVWLRKLLYDLFDLQLNATCIYCDNQSCAKLSENPYRYQESLCQGYRAERSSEAPICCDGRIDS